MGSIRSVGRERDRKSVVDAAKGRGRSNGDSGEGCRGDGPSSSELRGLVRSTQGRRLPSCFDSSTSVETRPRTARLPRATGHRG
jgi:hypothetical protein